MTIEKTSPGKKVALVLLSFIFPGVVQLRYSGWKRAIIILIVFSVLAFAVAEASALGLAALLCGLILLFGFLFWICLDALKLARSHTDRVRPSFGVFAGFALLVVILQGIIPKRTEAFKIPAGSMTPFFVPGDRIVVDLHAYRSEKPRRGDVVVFRYPKDPQLQYVKRILGVPGDQIGFDAKIPVINGEKLNWLPLEAGVAEEVKKVIQESKVRGEAKIEAFQEALDGARYTILVDQSNEFTRSPTGFPTTLKEGEYLLLGDNRDFSNDSRFFGMVPEKDIRGRYLYRYWPLRR